MDKEFTYIPGYLGLYQINGCGEIRNVKGKILKPRPNATGYFRITLYNKHHVSKTWFVHRLVALTFIPNTLNKPCINHINSIRTDNRIENLEWCTNSENQIHAFKEGNQQKGELRPLSKLNEAQVLSIKRLLSKGLTMRSIAERHGVSHTVVNQIKKGTSWKWI